jgi:hypothetical protein
MAYVTEADFINKFELTKSAQTATLIGAYISRYETITLQKLFGVELFDLWEAGLVATDPIYEFLRDPFTVQLDNGLILESKGIKDIILGVVYYHYVVDRSTQQTINGRTKSASENADNVNLLQSNVQSRYNEAVSSYHAIQSYVCDNLDVYPTFKGVNEEILSIF